MANTNKKFAVKNGLQTQNIDFISPDEANTIAVSISNSDILNVDGTLTANLFGGNGSSLTALNASNISTGTLAQARLANSSVTINGTTVSLGGTATITSNVAQALTLGSYLTGGSYNGGTAVTAAVDATTTNTASKIVARDINGSFAANVITATLSGSATTAGTVTTAAQPNITSVGTLSSVAVSGNANVGGLNSSGKIIGTNGGDLILNSATGMTEGAQITLAWKTVTGLTGQGNSSWNMDVDNSNNFRILSVDAGGTPRVPLTLYAGNTDATVTGNLSASYFLGNGSQLTGVTATSIPGPNVTGQVANALVAGTVYTAAQPNITSVGTLSSLSVTGDTTANRFISLNNGNALNFKVGDDAWLGDVNNADTVGIIGQQNPINGYLVFGNSDNSSRLGRSGSGPLTYAGAFSTTGNITTGNQLVSTVATGTAPAVVTSTTRVSNLNVAQAGVSDTSTIALASTGNYYPTFVNATSGNLAEVANATYVANIANGSFAATTFVGALSGTASSATTATKVQAAVTGTNTVELVRGDMADNDQFRILVGGTATNAGYVELATADDGTEPIYVRQYTGVFTTLARTATLLDASGDTQFPGVVTSTRYVSNVATGTAPLTVTSTTRVANLNVAYANVADFINVTAPGTGTGYLLFANATTGNVSEYTSAGISSNLANNSITATTFVGTLSGAATSATTAGTVTTAAQPNITSVGTLTSLAVTANITSGNLATGGELSVTGNAVITGNLTVNGSTIYSNVTTMNVRDPIIELGGTGNASNLTSNDGKDRGEILHVYDVSAGAQVDKFIGWDNSNAEFAFGSNVTTLNEVVTFNTLGNVRAGNFIGTHYGAATGLTSIPGANVTGTVANATYAVSAGSAGSATSATTAGTVTTAAQPNITSHGTLVNLYVNAAANAVSFTSNVATGTAPLTVTSTTRVSNLNVAYANVADFINVTAPGTGTGYIMSASATTGNVSEYTSAGITMNMANNAITATTFIGALSGTASLATYATTANAVAGANVSGTVANATYAVSAGSATTAGTVTTAAQPNITSHGTLTSLDVSGVSTLPKININRSSTATTGISWYSSGYSAWTDYMSPAAATGAGPFGNITAPSGTLVTGWALRRFIENSAGYGWTFESGTAQQVTPTVVAEIRSSDGAARFGSVQTSGTITTTNSTAATSTTTGAVIVTGGIGVSGNSYLSNMTVKSNVAHVSPNGANTITNQMLNGGTLAWTGTSGQLFSITDSMTGTVFSVNDTSGIPSIEVLDTGLIKFAEYGGFVAYGVSNALTATGSTQGTALELVRPINNITTTAASTGIRFPVAIPGMRLIVRNSGANTLSVYPATGAAINALSTNAAYSLGVSAMIEFVAMSTTQWYTMGATYA